MVEKPKKQGVEIKVPAGQFKLTGYAPTVTVSSSAAALMEIASTTTEREKISEADQILWQQDIPILTALAAEPDGPLAQELDLPDLSPVVIRSLAESVQSDHQKNQDRRSGLFDHFAKGGIGGAIVYLKSLLS